MLHKLTSTYQEIAKYFPELANKLSEACRTKKLLLEMAERGETKPRSKNNKIGRALLEYTSKSSKTYDPTFTKEIKKLAPQWLVRLADICLKKKRKLLAMAKKGCPRPRHNKHPLGTALVSYTSEKSRQYDPAFTKEIRKLAPHWFVSRTQKANQKKQTLIKMARNGDPKPNKKHHLGLVIRRYTSEKSRQYDPAFTKEIRKLAPHWLVSPSEITIQKKNQLLNLASKGKPRPNQKTKLGSALVCYISKRKPRPNQKTKLGSALVCYTTKSKGCFDPAFTKQIKKRAPHWFRRKK